MRGDGRPSPPSAPEAEAAVLGAVFADAETAERAVASLSADDFLGGKRRRVFGAVERVHERGGSVDAVTVADELRSAGELDAAGGMEHLAKFVDAWPNGDGLDHHVAILREKRAQREALHALRDAEKRVGEARSGEVGAVLTEARESLEGIRGPTALEGLDLVTLADALQDPTLTETPDAVVEGVAYVNQNTILGGPPKLGKTSCLQSAAAAVAGDGQWLGRTTGRGPVAWLMGEGDRGEILRGLHRFGADPDRTHVIMAGASPVEELRVVVEELEPALVVIDTWNTWSAPLGLDNWRSDSVAPVLRQVERIIRDSGAALVLIHHTRKADDELMDSQALKAWADIIRILKATDRPDERKVTGTARAGFKVEEFRYRLVEGVHTDRVELVDPSAELEQRILDYVERNPDCSKRAIREGVEGSNTAIDAKLEWLSDGPRLDVDTSGQAYQYRTPRNPHGHGTGTVEAR